MTEVACVPWEVNDEKSPQIEPPIFQGDIACVRRAKNVTRALTATDVSPDVKQTRTCNYFKRNAMVMSNETNDRNLKILLTKPSDEITLVLLLSE